MKSFGFLFAFIIISLFSCESPPDDRADESNEAPVAPVSQQFYQLKTYILDTEEQVATTDEYLQNAFIPGLRKLGIGPVGVFKDRPTEEDTVDRTFVLVPFESLEQFEEHDKLLMKDNSYLTAGSTYLNAPHDNPPYVGIELVLLKAFEDMPVMATPKLKGPRENRVYELRSYISATEKLYWNKVDMFNEGGEVLLFDSLDFNAIFYGEVLSGPTMPNLMYMTSFENMEDRDEHWKQFTEAPQWKRLVADPQYQNNVSNGKLYFLYPTEYSDY